MKQTDAQLVKEVLKGNTASFGILVRKYQGAVYGLAYHLVKDFTEAEDIAQEAFLQAYLNLSQLRDLSKFAGWLKRITCNICKMWLRSQPIGQVSLEATTEDGNAQIMPNLDEDNPASEAERKELCDAVLEAINSLSEKNRLAVTLFYIDGLSYRQISEFLELPVTTIESRLHKARKQLKEGMVQMVRQDFGEKKLGSDFATKIIQGTLEIVSDPPVYGFIRRGKRRVEDVYVSPSQIRKLNLNTGDTVVGQARPPKEDMEEHYYAMLYIYTVNGKDPITGADAGDSGVLSKVDLESGIEIIEGKLELVPYLYGFIRRGGSEKDDVYVGPSQIRNFNLETGAVIKGEARPPKKDSAEQSYVLVHINEVNDEDPTTA